LIINKFIFIIAETIQYYSITNDCGIAELFLVDPTL